MKISFCPQLRLLGLLAALYLTSQNATADYLLTLRNAYFDAGLNRIVRLSDAGVLRGDVVPASEVASSGLSGPTAIQPGVGTDFLVTSTFGNELLRFDGISGDFLERTAPSDDAPPSPGFDGPTAMRTDDQGRLLITNLGEFTTGFMGGSVTMIDASTGDFLGNFGEAHVGAAGVLFDGNSVYISEFGSNQVLRFDDLGVLQETIADPLISGPTGLAIDPSTGNLLIASVNSDRIASYDGNRVTTYLATPAQFFPSGIYFTSDNEFLVTSAAVGSILQYEVGNPIPLPLADFTTFGLTQNDLLNGVAIGDLVRVESCDLDADGVCNAEDIDGLVAAIARGDDREVLDLSGDGQLDLGDVTFWLASAGEVNLANGQSYLVGDANLDGVVDISDFHRWNANKFTNTGGWSQGDFNADGVTNVADFDLWNQNKFQAAVAAVPEPSAGCVWCGWVWLAWLCRASRKPSGI